jgi:choline monooxygenase
MSASIDQILSRYNDRAPLSEASTIPAPWYVDPRIAELERVNVFSKTWQLVARTEQVAKAGEFVSARLAGEPIVIVRGSD